MKNIVLIIALSLAIFSCNQLMQGYEDDVITPFQIRMDGSDSDWSAIANTADNPGGTVTSIAAYFGNSRLYLLARGSGLDAVTDWFLDTDNNSFTGYLSAGGVDYLIENGNAYRYSGDGTDWNWTFLDTARTEEVRSDTVVETSVVFPDINFDPHTDTLKIGFQSDHTYSLPDIGTLAAVNSSGTAASEDNSLYPDFSVIPNALGMAIDDVGWLDWYPGDNSRDPVPGDYQTIINVGKNLGIRIMTAFMILDFDKTNISADPSYNMPTAPSDMSASGTAFDNPYKDDPQLDTIMDIYRNNAANIELGVHGVAHEHWGPAGEERAEFAHIYPFPDIYHSDPWGTEDNTNKLQCWEDILRLYFTEEECSFPESMVPPGHAWFFGSDGKGSSQSTGSVAGSFGVKYVNCDMDVSFAVLDGVNPAGVIDNGVLVMHRASGALYYAEGETAGAGDVNQFEYPEYPNISYSWIEAHFPNYWNAEDIWTDYLSEVNDAPDRMLAKNTAQTASQWFYTRKASISGNRGTYVIDTAGIPDGAYTNNLLSVLVLKTPLYGRHISAASITGGAEITGYWEDDYGYGYLMIGHESNTMGRLSQGSYTLQVQLGRDFMETYVDLTESTCNVFSFQHTLSSAEISLVLYGTQDIRIKIPFVPRKVESESSGIIINSWNYDAGFIAVSASGEDIQGESGRIFITK